MSYLRRLLTKTRSSTARLSARRLPPYATTETQIEERDEDVLVSPPATARTSHEERAATRETRRPLAEPPGLDREARALRPLDPNPGSILPEPVERTSERIANVAAEAQPERHRKRVVVEHRRHVTHARADAFRESIDDQPLIAVAELSSAPLQRAPTPHAVEPVVRELPASPAHTSAGVAPSTVVNVVIGRIDVRAAHAAPAKESRAEPFKPRVSLEAYLARGSGAS